MSKSSTVGIKDSTFARCTFQEFYFRAAPTCPQDGGGTGRWSAVSALWVWIFWLGVIWNESSLCSQDCPTAWTNVGTISPGSQCPDWTPELSSWATPKLEHGNEWLYLRISTAKHCSRYGSLWDKSKILWWTEKNYTHFSQMQGGKLNTHYLH